MSIQNVEDWILAEQAFAPRSLWVCLRGFMNWLQQMHYQYGYYKWKTQNGFLKAWVYLQWTMAASCHICSGLPERRRDQPYWQLVVLFASGLEARCPAPAWKVFVPTKLHYTMGQWIFFMQADSSSTHLDVSFFLRMQGSSYHTLHKFHDAGLRGGITRCKPPKGE